MKTAPTAAVEVLLGLPSLHVMTEVEALVKLAEHNRIQLVWVPGHVGIHGSEIADQLVREGSSHPPI
jgi:ribonuclease HI